MHSGKPIKSTGMPLKQKITIGATIVVVLLVIWQAKDLIFEPSTTTAPAVSTPAPTATAQAPRTAMNTMAPSTGMPAASPPTAMTPKEVPLVSDQLQDQKKAEQRYLKQLNDLEQLKLEQQIEETNQAIAIAKLATVTAEKNTADLLTKPTPTVSEGAYANQLVSPTRSGVSVEGEDLNATQPLQPPPEPKIPETAYSVISVSMQLNKWMAVIGAEGKLYNVSVGDVLPLDGSVVSSINKNGVILKKNDKVRKISITSAI